MRLRIVKTESVTRSIVRCPDCGGVRSVTIKQSRLAGPYRDRVYVCGCSARFKTRTMEG